MFQFFFKSLLRYFFIVYIYIRNLWNSGLFGIWYLFIIYCFFSICSYLYLHFFFIIAFFFEKVQIILSIFFIGKREENPSFTFDYFVFDSATSFFFVIISFIIFLFFCLIVYNFSIIFYFYNLKKNYFSFIYKRKYLFNTLLFFVSVIFFLSYLKNIFLPFYIWYFFYFENDYYSSSISFYPEISFTLFFYEFSIVIIILLILYSFQFYFYLFKKQNLLFFIFSRKLFYVLYILYTFIILPPHFLIIGFSLSFFLIIDTIIFSYFWLFQKKHIILKKRF